MADGFFLVRFSNRKKQGRYPLRMYDAYGVIFPDTRHVVLDTEFLPQRGFDSLQDMMDYLSQWGDYDLIGMEESSCHE